MFQAAISEGYGELDMCSTIRVMERWAGVEVKGIKKYKKLLHSRKSYTSIGISRGGNSHQSETNLIKKTPEAILPGARKGLGLARIKRLSEQCHLDAYELLAGIQGLHSRLTL